ncbi:MAG: DUF1848 domain-containing protein [Spirochaetales bacterium]|nr:DUF1848 domain-containing protein [Spirochaetales bacterium]
MIINSGNRTDIPAFFSDWFYNRIREGYVLVRNPYYPEQITRYELNPQDVDILAFCSKNPGPMLGRLDELAPYRNFWHVTITPYGRDAEPHVPPWEKVAADFKVLSRRYGPTAVQWRYDPIFITEKYTREFHLEAFGKMAAALEGFTRVCIISFIDLYEKTKRNFPGVREVSREDRRFLAEGMAGMAEKHGMILRTCMEYEDLADFSIDTGGCMTKEVLEEVLSVRLEPGRITPKRNGCPCLLGIDIGEYNTCLHGCLYCYANFNRSLVERNFKKHDPLSPLLIGVVGEGEEIKQASQRSFIPRQGYLF